MSSLNLEQFSMKNFLAVDTRHRISICSDFDHDPSLTGNSMSIFEQLDEAMSEEVQGNPF